MARLAWSSLLDGLLEAVWLVEPVSLTVVAANPAALTLLRCGPEHLVGRPVVELAATPEDQFFWEDVAAGLSDTIHSETWLNTADGEAVAVLRRVSRVWPQPDQPLYLVAVYDLRQQRRIEGELERLIAELRATLESTADGILVTDLHGNIRNANRHFARLWQVPADLLTARNDAALWAHMTSRLLDPEKDCQRLQPTEADAPLERVDVLALQQGQVLECVLRPQISRGQTVGRVYSFRDITQHLHDQGQLRLAAKVFDSSLEPIFITDPAFTLVAANPASERLALAGQQAPLVGRSVDQILTHAEQAQWLAAVRTELEQHGQWRGRLQLLRADASRCDVQASWVVLRHESGRWAHTLVFLRDLSDELAAQQRIEQLAYTDALTGLANRLLLSQRAEFALRLAERNREHSAVIFIDLDRFKTINDSLGHAFGDRLLVEVARRLTTNLRDTDTLCRLGGDEFVLFAQGLDAHGAEVLAQRLQRSLAADFVLDEVTLSVGASMGVALYPEDGTTLDALIQCADTAMYRVKAHGRGSFRFYQPQMNVNLLSHIKLEHAMRRALEQRQFQLHYQPQVALDGGRLLGCEALARWRDPELGHVSPGQFIPLAEESGFIIPLGTWVLEEAVRQAHAWWQAGQAVVVGVNVSALQFQQADFVQTVAQVLRAQGLPARWLELELTESILIQDAEETLARLHELARLGVALSIDDFGTGYSSLAYLKKFPIHQIKIDRSFVCGLPQDEGDRAIVTATIGMARGLKLQVVAEGVETPAQADCLRQLGCTAYQGYLCTPPLPPEEFARHVQPLRGAAGPTDTI